MSRAAPPPEPETDEFMVLFTALSMILLAFFVMLNSLATIDDGRTRVVVDSLVGTFGVLPGYRQRRERIEIDQGPRARGPQQAERLLRLASSMIEPGEQTGVSVIRRADGRVIIRMDAEVFFEPGHVHISPLAFPTLDTTAELLRSARVPARVEGHTDATPTTGPRSNWYLSGARAASVFRYLHEAGGVPLELLYATGHAATRPPPDETTPARRVEIVFVPDRQEGPR